MKRTIITSLLQIISVLTISAQPRSESDAMSIAQDFFENEAKARGATHEGVSLTLVSSIEIAKAIGHDVRQVTRANSVNVGIYIFNDEPNHRFVIVSGDERQYETLGSSENCAFDPANIPCGLLTFLEQYADEYTYLQESGENAVSTDTVSEARKAYSNTSPLIKTKWNQDAPYNNLCPYVSGGRCLTGCVATAMAQIMNYHQYPDKGEGVVRRIGGQNRLSSDALDLSAQSFDWNSLVGYERIYTSSSSSTKNAVAYLMKACGYAVRMDYGTSQQGGSGAYAEDIPIALRNYFGYNKNVSLISKSGYTLSAWESIIQEELRNKRPIIYLGHGDGGHCFILDGYQASSGKYYFNWGWSGYYDGAFSLSSLRPGGSNFSNYQMMVYNIYPESNINIEKPVINIDTDFDVATITCTTPDVKLYYSFTPQDQSYTSSYSRYYGSKIDITCNGTFRAYAELMGKKVYATEQKVTWYMVERPEFYPDGNKLTIKCPSASAIYYTKNGQYPSKNSTRYTGPITCTNGMTIKAIGVKDNYLDSYSATYYYKEEIKTVYNIYNTAGHLMDKIGWNNRNNVISLTVSGQLNSDDMSFIHTMSSYGVLSRIDLKNATIDSEGKGYAYVPDKVIPNYAFHNCTNLTSIVLPSNTVEISYDAFHGCSSLTQIDIPVSCTKIGDHAFDGAGLTSLSIPKNVSNIDYGFVQGCKSLISLNVDKGNKIFDSRDNCNAIIRTVDNEIIAGCKRTFIPNTIVGIDDDAFCSSPKVLYVPESVYSIGYSAFENNNDIEEITIEEGCVFLGSKTFKNCTNLKTVTIPSTISYATDVFQDCTSLKTFTTYHKTPLTIDSGFFEGSSYKSATLRVPYGCKSKYQSAAVWKDFLTIEEMPIVLNSIAEVKALADGQYATLNLDEAQVTYAYNGVIDEVYLRDKTGAINLYGSDAIAKLNIKAGDIISGKIPVRWGKKWGNIHFIDYQYNPRHFSVTGHQTVLPSAVTPAEVGNAENDYNLIAVEDVILFGGVDYLYFNSSSENKIWVSPIDGLKPEDYDAILATTRDIDFDGKKYNLIGIQRLHNGLYLTQPIKEGASIKTINIDSTNFPDENFRNYLLSQNYGQDGVLSESEISRIYEMKVPFREIGNLKGIEFFTALTSLDCYYNQLTSIDVSQNTALTSLSCFGNQLTSIDISKNAALKSLNCGHNQIDDINLSKNTVLEDLYCYGNKMTKLDLSKNTALEFLYCSNNKLTALDVSNNTKLFSLSCEGNIIRDTSMDNLISSLPQNTTGLMYYFQVVDPSSSNEGNVCTKDQVNVAKAKGWLPCYWDEESQTLKEYVPIELTIDSTNFPDENFRNYLLSQSYGQDGILTDNEINTITDLLLQEKEIEDLKGIEFFSALRDLNCGKNRLSSLDVTKNRKLESLYCGENPLSTLDISKNTELIYIDCSSTNRLTSLDISNNTSLKELDCSGNALTSLDVSKLKVLETLYCQNNKLEVLDLSNNTELCDLMCNNNTLTSLVIAQNAFAHNPRWNSKRLLCFRNKLRGDAMDAFINSLPTVSDTVPLTVLYNSNEENHITKLQVEAARAKGWIPQKYNGYEWQDVVFVTSITLNKTNLSIQIGQNETLITTVEPDNATDKTVLWASEDTSIAAVDDNGKVTAIGKGTTTITCTACDGSGIQAACAVTVTNPMPDKIVLQTEVTVQAGQTITLTPEVTPSNAEYTLTWSSDDETVATVNQNGVVKGVKKGRTFINVETDNGKTAYCKLTVTAAEPESIELPKTATVTVGGTFTLTPTILPEGAETTLTWKSDDEAVVWVSTNGVLTGVAEGLAIVTVSTSNGLTSNACKVTVEPDPSGISTVMMDEKVSDPIYSTSGQRLAAPRKGINIIGRRKVVVR